MSKIKFLIFGIVFLFSLINVNAAWFSECSNSCTIIDNGARCDHWTGVTDYTNGCLGTTLRTKMNCQGNSVYGDRIYNSPECMPKTEPVQPTQPVQPSCSNECSSGEKQCLSSNEIADFIIRECGNFDGDSCLEWGLTNRYCDKTSKDSECQQICGSIAPAVIAPDVVVKKPESVAKIPPPVIDVQRPTKQTITKEAIQACSEDSLRCGSTGNQEKCISGNWKAWNTCSNGCSENNCNSASNQPIIAPVQVTQVNIDFNNNGCSDFTDFIEFGNNFGSASSKYDLDKNGEVDFKDFIEFSKAYNQTQCGTQTTPLEQVEKEIDCNLEPLKCYNIKRKDNRCNDLKLGEKCEVSWEIEVDEKAALSSQIGLNVNFDYETKSKEKKENRVNTVLRVLNEISNERKFALTSNSVLKITGKIVVPLNLGVNRVGRFECSLKPNSGVCCPSPFFMVSSQNPNLCVRAQFRTESGIALIDKQSVLSEIGDKMQRFLSSEDIKEKEELERELRELDSKLRE